MTQQKKQMLMTILPIVVCAAGILFLNNMWQCRYERDSYRGISALCQTILENDPGAEELLLSSLKEYQSQEEWKTGGNVFLEQFGYTEEDFSGSKGCGVLFAVNAAVLISAAFFLSSRSAKKHIEVRVSGLTKYLEQVNAGKTGTIVQTIEDEFSHLQDEIYKTVTSLYVTRENALKAKERFADNLANIAHQLKTPLTAALLSLQLMEKTAPNTYTKPIKNQLERLNRLEESLLTLSKIDSGALLLEHSPVDVYTVLNLAVENLEELMRREKVMADIPDKGCVEFQGDMEWTMEALMNLIKNCAEHSPEEGRIHCDYSQNPLYTEILIWDEGQGFAPEDIPHLFERFYRGKRAVKGGIGIGLALACSLFELQGGTLSARNLPAGGACFEIRFYSH
nr:HAMP domain-containing sensor histidine kinase [uncultured Blautia sp.]